MFWTKLILNVLAACLGLYACLLIILITARNIINLIYGFFFTSDNDEE